METAILKKLQLCNKFGSWLVSSLFIFGLFIPTSINSTINKNITIFGIIILFVCLCILMMITQKVKMLFFISFLLINIVVWAATLFNPQAHIMKTPAILFFLVSVLFCVSFKRIDANKSITTCFKIINIVVILIGFSMILHNNFVDNIFIRFYSDFYPELVPNMLERGKPVITFGTHSVAAFYFFIFFYMNFRTYSIANTKIHLIFAVTYLYFCISLSSNTSFIFLAIGIFILLKKIRYRFIWLIVPIAGVVFYMLYNQNEASSFYSEMVMNITDTFSSNANGIIGRYSGDGNQMHNIKYILGNPFSPTGFSAPDNSDLIFFDSGLIVTALQGTFLLTALLYGTLFMFLKHNILNKNVALLIFSIFMIFEIGFNNLFYFRTLCILPFLVLYLNYIERIKIGTNV